MKIGYSKPLKRKETKEDQYDLFRREEVAKIHIEEYRSEEVFPGDSVFNTLLSTTRSGDTLVIPSFERVSTSWEIWRQIYFELKEREVALQLIDSPHLDGQMIETMIQIGLDMEKSKPEKSRIVTVGKETSDERRAIRPFTNVKPKRQLYQLIFKALWSGSSLRRTATRYQVSQGTVLRIKRDVSKTRQVIWLVGTFIVTVFALKIAQTTTNNWLIQVLICAIATVSIIYLTYADSKEER